LKPVDIAQADLTPTFSALLGLPSPKNNVGKLPRNILRMPHEQVIISVISRK